MKKLMKRAVYILSALIFSGGTLLAQIKDTALLFKRFVSICNTYKRLPLQLSIEYSKSSNIVVKKNDTSVEKGFFYIQADGAYIRFGNIEQIITDSCALMVLGDINRMIISSYKTDIVAQISGMLKMPAKDFLFGDLSARYNIQENTLNNDTSIFRITNKQNVYGAKSPLETFTLTYNARDENPIKIETIKRRLIKKDTDGKIQLPVETISIPEKGDYFIKEDVEVYAYKSINHDRINRLPVMFADRVKKDISGNYIPVAAFKNYTLTVN